MPTSEGEKCNKNYAFSIAGDQWINRGLWFSGSNTRISEITTIYYYSFPEIIVKMGCSYGETSVLMFTTDNYYRKWI